MTTSNVVTLHPGNRREYVERMSPAAVAEDDLRLVRRARQELSRPRGRKTAAALLNMVVADLAA